MNLGLTNIQLHCYSPTALKSVIPKTYVKCKFATFPSSQTCINLDPSINNNLILKSHLHSNKYIIQNSKQKINEKTPLKYKTEEF
jgi:hypothetical protein